MAGGWTIGIGIFILILGIIGIIAAVVWNNFRPAPPTGSTWSTGQIALLVAGIILFIVGAIVIVIGLWRWYISNRVSMPLPDIVPNPPSQARMLYPQQSATRAAERAAAISQLEPESITLSNEAQLRIAESMQS